MLYICVHKITDEKSDLFAEFVKYGYRNRFPMFLIAFMLLIMNDIEIRKYLHKIIESKTFAPVGVYKRLLEYLTEATLHGEKPKEFTIGYEIFNQKVDDPSSSKIRVAVYKLRKKLEKYYKEEGVDDQIRFSIPKGGYTLIFIPNTNVTKRSINKNIGIAVFALALLVIFNLAYYFSQRSDYVKIKKTAFWNELIDNGLDTYIVAGDFFVFSNTNLKGKEGNNYNLRDVKINSEQELRDYVNSSDSLILENFSIPKNASYLQRDALFSMPYIIPVLDRNDVNYKIILSSDFNWELFNRENIIYIGVFKNMKSLSVLTKKLNIEYNSVENTLKCKMSDTSFVLYPKNDENAYTDYVLVSKIPGPHNNVIYFFNSIFDIGCIDAIKNFTLLDSVKSFERRILQDASYFSAIYKVEGVERSAVSFNLLEFQSITDSTLNSFWKK